MNHLTCVPTILLVASATFAGCSQSIAAEVDRKGLGTVSAVLTVDGADANGNLWGWACERGAPEEVAIVEVYRVGASLPPGQNDLGQRKIGQTTTYFRHDVGQQRDISPDSVACGYNAGFFLTVEPGSLDGITGLDNLHRAVRFTVNGLPVPQKPRFGGYGGFGAQSR